MLEPKRPGQQSTWRPISLPDLLVIFKFCFISMRFLLYLSHILASNKPSHTLYRTRELHPCLDWVHNPVWVYHLVQSFPLCATVCTCCCFLLLCYVHTGYQFRSAVISCDFYCCFFIISLMKYIGNRYNSRLPDFEFLTCFFRRTTSHIIIYYRSNHFRTTIIRHADFFQWYLKRYIKKKR